MLGGFPIFSAMFFTINPRIIVSIALLIYVSFISEVGHLHQIRQPGKLSIFHASNETDSPLSPPITIEPTYGKNAYMCCKNAYRCCKNAYRRCTNPDLFTPNFKNSDWWYSEYTQWRNILIDSLTEIGLKPFTYTSLKFKYLPISCLFSRRKQVICPGKKAFLFLSIILIMQAGDCETNPGPINNSTSGSDDSCSKFPCAICKNPCTWNQRAVQCDACDDWYHTDCMHMNTNIYNALGLSGNINVSWICCTCGIPNFSTSLFSQWTTNLSNSFSSLDTLNSIDDSPLSPPVASSSPKVCTPPKQTRHNANKTVKVMVVNFQSLKNKTADLKTCLSMQNPEIVIGTETWLNPDISNNELFPDTYTVVRKDRDDAHGGVLIAVRNDIIYTHAPDLDTDCEIIWIQIKLARCKSLTIGAFYRPPHIRDPAYLDELRKSLNKNKNSHKGNTWLAGDFNLGDILWENQSIRKGSSFGPQCQQLIDIANDFNLDQMVTEPTRGSNILDLFFTTNSSLVDKSTVIPGISDHDGIALVTINTSPKRCPQNLVRFTSMQRLTQTKSRRI